MSLSVNLYFVDMNVKADLTSISERGSAIACGLIIVKRLKKLGCLLRNPVAARLQIFGCLLH